MNLRVTIAGFRLRAAVTFCVLCAIALQVSPAVADGGGEAGLVVQDGGKVDTYCIALPDGGMNGEQLLTAAGYRVESFKSSSGNTVCALNDTGCFAPTDFNSCFCKSFPPESTYWAFFTMKAGRWQYSSIAANRVIARDGDVHGWKWGQGGPSSAPAPVTVPFEQICGHPAGAGATPPAPATNTAVQQPPSPAVSPTAAGAAATAASSTGSTPATTAAIVTVTPLAIQTQEPTAVAGSSTIVVTAHGTSTAVPAPPATGATSGSGGGAGSLIAFGAVAAALVAGIAGAAIWRRRHGR